MSRLDVPAPRTEATRVGARTDVKDFDGRLRILILLFAVPFLGLVAQLWNLQVRQGDDFYRTAAGNFVRTVELAPDRGVVYDARGRVLAENRPAWDVYITPAIFRRHTESAAPLLARLLSLSEEEASRVVARIASGQRADILVRRDITRDQLAAVETSRNDLPGVYVRANQRRYYPYGTLGAHMLGFMNEIRLEEQERLEPVGYRSGDYVGRTGLERAFEAVLRGASGRERQVVDVRGNVRDEAVSRQLLGDYRRIEPVPGKDLHLTVDVELLAIVEEAAASHVSGGIVVLDPRDGAVMAMFSKPGFNPNAWSGRLSEQEQRLSDNNPFHPMLDKSVQSYFPGSTYKIITALAGLAEGIVTPADTYHCPGYLQYGDRRFHCWNRSGHGDMNLRDAMAASCDVYFYEVGLALGMDRLAQYAFEFGFGERPGLGFNGDSAGVVPTREWHEQNSPSGFQYGFTVNTSVGQGDTRVSPLQLALAYAALANGGTLYYPRVVDRITNVEGDVLFEYPRRVRRVLRIAADHQQAVTDSLRAVMHSEVGTGSASALPYMDVAGKSGTAQVRSLETVRLEDGEIVFRDRDHAWFVAFAPADDPQIVVSVFMEHGGGGSSTAAPVVMQIIDRYFREVRGLDDVISRTVATGDRTELQRLLAAPAPAGRPLDDDLRDELLERGSAARAEQTP